MSMNRPPLSGCRLRESTVFSALLFLLTLPPSLGEDQVGQADIKRHTIAIPAATPGYTRDPEHEFTYAVYRINGQIFAEGGSAAISPADNGAGQRETPISVLSMLLRSYAKGDVDGIAAAYTPQSRNAIQSILSKPKTRDQFLASVGQIKQMQAKVGFEHREGYVLLVGVPLPSGEAVMPYYFKDVEGKWFLSTLTDTSPLLSNLAVFLKSNRPADLISKAPQHGGAEKQEPDGSRIPRRTPSEASASP